MTLPSAGRRAGSAGLELPEASLSMREGNILGEKAQDLVGQQTKAIPETKGMAMIELVAGGLRAKEVH